MKVKKGGLTQRWSRVIPALGVILVDVEFCRLEKDNRQRYLNAPGNIAHNWRVSLSSSLIITSEIRYNETQSEKWYNTLIVVINRDLLDEVTSFRSESNLGSNFVI